MRMGRGRLLASVLAASMLGTGVGALGVSGAAQQGAAAATRTTAKTLAFTARGVPNLHGWSIPIATAGSHPGIEDTLGYIIEKTLQRWGATSSLNLAEAPTGADAVVAGKIDAVNSDMPSLLNLPLEIFMPNQVRLDYVFVSRDATTLADLKGKTIDVGTLTSAEYTLMPALLKYAHLTKADVHYDVTGSSSGSSLGTVLVTGQADAAWVHVSAVQSIRSALHGNLYVLAKATKVLPGIADSFWAAKPSFLRSDPAIAEALCLAWIAAAKTFNDHWQKWVADGEQYTLNADPASAVQQDHTIFKSLDLWRFSKNVYTPEVVRYNYAFYRQYGEFAGAGVRPMSKVATFVPWQAAWAAYEAHPDAY